jgi:quinol-cytochrome oxidoreductase complex cytochrome b subunit
MLKLIHKTILHARRGAVQPRLRRPLNPLYHLGAITFFLFWVVGGSGLYLYIFFETGVADAYASVEALTHGQWWLGGIMRSVHRYASDGMVLTMMLHMVRHFAFDRTAASAGSPGSPAWR